MINRKHITALIGVAVAGLILFLWIDTSAAQDDQPEEENYLAAVPLMVEFVDGDVAITQVGDGLFVISDQGLHEKLDRIESKINMLSQQSDGDLIPPDTAVNINEATYDELLSVRGIGPVTAGSIIAERGQGGVFQSWFDLQSRVAGVGPTTIANIQAEGATLE